MARTLRRDDRAAVNRLLGLVKDPTAHGRHAIEDNGKALCEYGARNYKWGYAPCQLSSEWRQQMTGGALQ